MRSRRGDAGRRDKMRRSGTTFVLAASLLLGLPAAARAEGRPADHVVLVSVDGLLPEYYLRPAEFGLELPNLTALREAGSWAEACAPSPASTPTSARS